MIYYYRSRNVNPPHGDLVLFGVSIHVRSRLDILGEKVDRASLPSKTIVRGIVSLVSQRFDS